MPDKATCTPRENSLMSMNFDSVEIEPDEYAECLPLGGWESLTGNKSLHRALSY